MKSLQSKRKERDIYHKTFTVPALFINVSHILTMTILEGQHHNCNATIKSNNFLIFKFLTFEYVFTAFIFHRPYTILYGYCTMVVTLNEIRSPTVAIQLYFEPYYRLISRPVIL
uniref:Uncharacterized protein n=1 Tax=Glossina brevipalpis TaxID=37001 RepID=A0A1A9WLG3_9MUSC